MNSGVYSTVSLSNSSVFLTCLDTDNFFSSAPRGGVQDQDMCQAWKFVKVVPPLVDFVDSGPPFPCTPSHQTSAKSTTESSGKRNPPGFMN